MKNLGNQKDITGQKFGVLTALNFEGIKGTGYFWKFRCDCGNEVIKNKGNVVNGHAKYCKCAKKIRTTTRESGTKGVNWDEYHNDWHTNISVLSKQMKLGHYENLEEAIKMRKFAEKVKGEVINEMDSKPKIDVIKEFKQRIKQQEISLQNTENQERGKSMTSDVKKRSNYGEVTKINRDTKIGFIMAEDGVELFFVDYEVKEGYNNLVVGDKVVFAKVAGYQTPTATAIRKVIEPIKPKLPTPEEIFKKKALEVKGIYGIEPTSEEDPLLWEADSTIPNGFPWITKENNQYLVKYEEGNNDIIVKFLTIPESFKELSDAQKECKLLCHYLAKDKSSEGYKATKVAQRIEEAKKKFSLNLFKK